jgi:hypothetical protein
MIKKTRFPKTVLSGWAGPTLVVLNPDQLTRSGSEYSYAILHFIDIVGLSSILGTIFTLPGSIY